MRMTSNNNDFGPAQSAPRLRRIALTAAATACGHAGGRLQQRRQGRRARRQGGQASRIAGYGGGPQCRRLAGQGTGERRRQEVATGRCGGRQQDHRARRHAIRPAGKAGTRPAVQVELTFTTRLPARRRNRTRREPGPDGRRREKRALRAGRKGSRLHDQGAGPGRHRGALLPGRHGQDVDAGADRNPRLCGPGRHRHSRRRGGRLRPQMRRGRRSSRCRPRNRSNGSWSPGFHLARVSGRGRAKRG